MGESVQQLQTEFLIEEEKARLEREKSGEHTKISLGHLLNAARIQLRLERMTTGLLAQQHREIGYKLIKEAHGHMQRLGLIEQKETPKEAATPEEQITDSSKDEAVQAKNEVQEEPDEDPYETLNNLIGLKTAKDTVNGILSQLEVNRLRKENGVPQLDVPLHMVFMGSAGTGKTTVARIVAKVFKRMGLLSKGHLVEVSSGDLIAGYVGQTATKTKEIIERAKGGVLFIDEAYALADSKFGLEEAIPSLLIGMENYRDDLAVVVAGYTENMRAFIKSNQGLTSRFTHYVYFDDYTSEEMLEIFLQMGKKMCQTLSEGAKRRLEAVLEDKRKDPDFGNARGVRNLFNQVNIAQANRLREMRLKENFADADVVAAITTVDEKDIVEAAAKFGIIV